VVHKRPDGLLESIFALQETLNDRIFTTQGITAPDGRPLTMEAIAKSTADEKLMANDLPNQWLLRYSRAIEAELDELKADLRWKWWSKDRIDIQNIRVELVDILHFLVSAMIAAGLTPEKVHELYVQKHDVNVKRQESGYSRLTKDEADNRGIR
jgi:dimeric dUTPase (all-alpha-NTP-PPase superfamily)